MIAMIFFFMVLLDPQPYDGIQSNYPPNNVNPITNHSPSENREAHASTNPDFDPNGVALAPFPDDKPNDSNAGARQHFNYDNLHHRYPSKENTGSNANGGSHVPLATYGGSQVPLAPL